MKKNAFLPYYKNIFKTAEIEGNYKNMIVGLIMYEKEYTEDQAIDIYDKMISSDWARGIFDINAIIDEMEEIK